MLQRDYIMMLITQFVDAVTDPLLHAAVHQDLKSIHEAEHAVGDLLQLDPETALMLTPESLVTMMDLSGIGDTVEGYAAYVLNKLASLYERRGDDKTSELRLAQARAVAVAFGWDLSNIPDELADLDRQLA